MCSEFLTGVEVTDDKYFSFPDFSSEPWGSFEEFLFPLGDKYNSEYHAKMR